LSLVSFSWSWVEISWRVLLWVRDIYCWSHYLSQGVEYTIFCDFFSHHKGPCSILHRFVCVQPYLLEQKMGRFLPQQTHIIWGDIAEFVSNFDSQPSAYLTQKLQRQPT
jgi:hypothetical protein